MKYYSLSIYSRILAHIFCLRRVKLIPPPSEIRRRRAPIHLLVTMAPVPLTRPTPPPAPGSTKAFARV